MPRTARRSLVAIAACAPAAPSGSHPRRGDQRSSRRRAADRAARADGGSTGAARARPSRVRRATGRRRAGARDGRRSVDRPAARTRSDRRFRATDSLIASAFPTYHCRRASSSRPRWPASRRSGSAQRQLAQQGDTRSEAGRAGRRAARRSPAPRAAPARAPRRDRRAGAKLARAVASERQLQEVMTDFWENHFSVFAGKGQTRLFLAGYDRDVIRPRALGKFRDLLGAVAKSPAMLFYLDQFQSTVDSTHSALAHRAARAHACAPCAARPRPERELRARAARAAHPRRGWRLHPTRRDRGRARADRVDDESAPGRRVHLPAGDPRRGREDGARPRAAGRSRHRGRRGGARHLARASGDGAVHRAEARGAIRERRSPAGTRRSRGATFLRPTATSARRCARSSRARSSSAAAPIARR